jgi:hypothetical protein
VDYISDDRIYEEKERKSYTNDYRILSNLIFMIGESGSDIGYSYSKYEYRCDDEGECIYP